MKRSLGAAELPVVRPRVPETSDDRDAPVAPAPEEPVPAPLAVANAKPYVRMAFPGPFAYVPRPAAMEDGGANPVSAGSASNPGESSGEAGAAPAFADTGRSQNQVEPAIAAAAASTSKLSGASSTGSAASAANPNGYPPLILAAFTGNRAALEILLRDPALDIDQRDPKSGMSALRAAAAGGHMEMLRRLIAAGADVDLRRPLSDVTALMYAAATNRPDVVTHLLASGAKVDLVAGTQRRTALMAAAQHGYVEVVKQLVAHKDIVLDQMDAKGYSALHLAAEKNKPDVVACLLAAGAKVDLVAGMQRCTALMVAAQHGYVEVVKQLVADKDIVLDQTDAKGYSALHLAAEKNKPDVVACLLAAGAKVDLVAGTQRRTALMAAAQNGHVEVVKRLVANKGIALDQTEAKGCSALHFATANNKPEVVACLLAAGAKVDLMVGQRRLTALMMAAQNGHVEVMEKLVAHKDTALDKTDAEGFSALHWAAEKNKPDVIACLLAAGAGMTHLDATGRTALMFAIVKKHAAVVEVLVQCGAALPAFHAVDLALPRSVVAFAVTLADLDADRKSPADAQDNPLGLVAPQSLDDSLAVIDELLAVLESKQDLQQWLRAKGIRMACALPSVECLASLTRAWPVLASGARAATAVQKRLVCAAALGRLAVLTAEGKALAHYTAAGISAAGVTRLSVVATRQIEKLIAVSEELLTSMGSAMLENLIPDCLARTSLARQVDAEILVVNLVSAGWLAPLAQVIVTSWKSTLAALEAEPLAIAAGSTMQQINQCVFENIERKAPLHFSHAIQRAIAGPTLLAALRTWIGNAKSAEALDLLFQVQCDQLKQYCGQIASAS